jgi:hypothetical protein
MCRRRQVRVATAALCLIALLLCAPAAHGDFRELPALDHQAARATIHIPTPEMEYPVYLTTAVPRAVWGQLHPALKAVIDDIETGETLWFVTDGSQLSAYEAFGNVTSVEEVVTPEGTIGWVVTTYRNPLTAASAYPSSCSSGLCPVPSGTSQPTPGPTIAPVPTPVPAESSGPTASVSLRLDRGWNLFSFNVIPADRDVAAVLSTIAGKYSVVETVAGATLSYRPGLPASTNTLQTLDPFHGYWIRMEQAAKLTIAGTPVPATTPLVLSQGANLVSFLADGPLPVTEALSSIDGCYSAVLGFEGRALSFYPGLPPQVNTLQYLSPGHGYLIVMDTGGILAYPGS